MQTSFMRKLDTLAGLPLAWLLGMVSRRRGVQRPARPKRVLILKFFGIGSLLLIAAVLRRFKQVQPQAEVTVVTFASHGELQTLVPFFDQVLTIRTTRLTEFLQDVAAVFRFLRHTPVDLVVDLEYFSKFSSVFAACLGARYRLGFVLPAQWRTRLIDEGIAFREDIHFCENVARLLHPWGVDYHRGFQSVVLTIPEVVRQAAAQILTGEQPWILMNPNAHDMCLERRWPQAKFVRLIEQLAERLPAVNIGLVGAPAERAYAHQLREMLLPVTQARVHNFAGQTTLPVLAGMLNLARLLITNDSGIMHLAAASGTPMVALFGPETVMRYGPLAPPERCRVVAADVVCGPCLSYMNHKTPPCHGQNVCMQQISVEDVLAACEAMVLNT